MVNLQEILGPLDVFRKVTGLELQEIYNQMLARGWTLGSAQGLKFMHGVIRLYHRPAVRMLEKYWGDARGRTWWSRWCRTSIGRCLRA